MKKNLLLALALAAPAMAGVSAPLAVAPNPENMPAPAPVVSPWSMEIGAVYRWANDGIYENTFDVNVWGVDLTAIYKINDNHSVNVRLGYNTGDKSKTIIDAYTTPNGTFSREYAYDVDVRSFYIMPGYRYTDAITENVSWYAGANIGIANTKVECDCSLSEYYDFIGRDSLSADKWGLAVSAELGLQYHISESVYLYGAYQYWMSTARPSDQGAKAESQDYHSVTAGVGINF
jgi:opacity protein-like surface antigen